VRHEALSNRTEVRDHRRVAVAAAAWKLGAVWSGGCRGGREAAL